MDTKNHKTDQHFDHWNDQHPEHRSPEHSKGKGKPSAAQDSSSPQKPEDAPFQPEETDIDATAKAAQEQIAKNKTVTIKELELKKLNDDLAEAKDFGLRALAELENYRNRTNRVMAEERKYASMDLARDILPIWDNMGRALEAAEKDLNAETLINGVKMIHQQFVDVFSRHHIERINALHQPFDPNFHESIASLPNDEFPANTVIVETQPGFKLHERVVRPVQVVLAAPAPKPTRSEAKPQQESADANE